MESENLPQRWSVQSRILVLTGITACIVLFGATAVWGATKSISVNVDPGVTLTNNVGCGFSLVDESDTTLNIYLSTNLGTIVKSTLYSCASGAGWYKVSGSQTHWRLTGLDPTERFWCVIRVEIVPPGEGPDEGGPLIRWMSVSDVDLDADTDNNSTSTHRPPGEGSSEDLKEYPTSPSDNTIGLLVPLNDDNDVNWSSRDSDKSLNYSQDNEVLDAKLKINAKKAGSFDITSGLWCYDSNGNEIGDGGFSKSVSSGSFSKALRVEAKPEHTTGNTGTLESWFIPNTPRGGSYSIDKVKYLLIGTDLDVDSDNNGSIEGTNSQTSGEDFYENHPVDQLASHPEYKNGMLVGVNDDDDNNNEKPDNGWNGSDWDGDDAGTIQGDPDKADMKQGILRGLNLNSDQKAVLDTKGAIIMVTKISGDGALRLFAEDGRLVGAFIDNDDAYDSAGNDDLWDLLYNSSLSLRVEGLKPGTVELQVEIALAGSGVTIHEDKVKLTVMQVDADVDSDNNNGMSNPGRTFEEDCIEDKTGDDNRPGKFVEVNNNDTDNDGVPDFADGFNLDETAGNADDSCAGESFIPLVIELLAPIEINKAKVKITYISSDPAGTSREGEPCYLYEPADGYLRIWKKNGSSARNKASAKAETPGDYVEPTVYDATQLGFSDNDRTKTFYVEAALPCTTQASQQIKVEIDPDGDGEASWIAVDAVRMTPLTADTDIDSNNDGGPDLFDDPIEDKTPSCIIPKDEEGENAGQDCLKPLNLDVKPVLTGGKVILDAGSGVKIWTSQAKTTEVTLPKEYAANAVPTTLYVDGITKGTNPDITLTYKDKNDLQIGTDKVKVLVVETVSWAPAKAGVAFIWSSLPSLGTGDGTEFENQIKDQGFNVVWKSDSTGSGDNNFNDCTLGNYKALKNSGAFHVISHGEKGAHFAVYASDSLAGKAACDQWRFSSTLLGDDQIIGNNITTGADGVCNTTAVSPDTQVILPNQGAPNTTAITAGSNGILDTTPAVDDQVVGNTITTGANGICNTSVASDDQQVIDLNKGEPDQLCVSGGEIGMTTDHWPGDCYTVRVSSNWLSSNMATTLTANNSIAHWAICYSAQANSATGEAAVKEAAGGRWKMGYWDPTGETEATAVGKKFFERMNGTTDSTAKRTTGEAWDSGTGYSSNARMTGNNWTTLCPSPMKDNTVWPNGDPGNRYGWGCIIFDTYMNDTVAATNALVKVSGCPVYDRRWCNSGTNKYTLGFDYDKTGGTATTMRAVGEHCKNSDPDGGRRLDSNRVKPNDKPGVPENKEWSW